jgi:hypothetical protein
MGGKSQRFIFNTLNGNTSPKIESVALTIDLHWVGSLDRFGKPLAGAPCYTTSNIFHGNIKEKRPASPA